MECIDNMDEALSQLIRMSRIVGRDRTLVQGGGGNTSVKTADGKYMYIKASGTALKDMNRSRGWRRMRLDSVLSIIKDKSLTRLETHAREIEVVNRLLLACDDNVTGPARPSVEAHLHGFLGKCVIHLHPSAAGAFVNAKNGKAQLKKLFKTETIPPLWVPYTDPGSTLAKKIARLVGNYQKRFGKKPAILFLHKHGLLISAGNANTALRLVHKVIKRCNSRLKQPKAGKVKSVSQEKIKDIKQRIRRAFFKATGEDATISYFYDDEIAAFMAQKDAKEMLSAGVLTPDELVYSNGPAMWVERIETADIAKRLTLQIKKGEKHSIAFLVKNVGLFVAAKKKVAQTVRDIVAYSAFIRTNAKRMGGICSLNKRQRDFINKWEAEAFRKKVAGG
jgi:rhamnose utilization protein RhaD (predicted bifunctional aldolase and dehydrogenase)